MSSLSALTNLTELSLAGNQVIDISQLSVLTNLTELYLGSNQISEINPLLALTNLIELYLDNNNIQDISLLKDLKMLQELNIEGCEKITDDQVAELASVLGNTFYGIMQIAWENAGKKLRPAQKIGLARKLKSIQGDLQKGLEQVLTPEQQQAWEAHKAEKSG